MMRAKRLRQGGELLAGARFYAGHNHRMSADCPLATGKHRAVTHVDSRNLLPSKENSGEPNRIRTCDPLIKSQLLYQLSYGPTS